ncbi:tetratricopeptide repeat protein [bacterium]|nr:MAG: tetratricopeptide repeat protein [bacterium]
MKRIDNKRKELSNSKLRFCISVFLLFTPLFLYAQQQEYLNIYPLNRDPNIKKAEAVAITSRGDVFIVDSKTSAIYQFGITGSFVQRIANLKVDSKQYMLKNPVDIAVDLQDKIYILDKGDNSYYIYNPVDSTSQKFGLKGGDLGQLDEPVSITVDPAGYVYIANPENESVAIFTPNGYPLTWINGPTSNLFKKPIAVAASISGEVFVLDAEGPSVYVFDIYQQMQRSFVNLSSKPSVDIKSANDIAVLGNGDFLLIDEKQSKVSQFDYSGNLVRTIGIRGKAGKGTFENARSISGSLSKLDHLLILDEKTGQAQEFRIPMGSVEQKLNDSRIQVKVIEPELPPHIDLAVSAKGIRYYFDNMSRTIIKSLDANKNTLQNLPVKKAQALTVDGSGNIYVLDSDNDEVIMFDPSGVLIRKFGQEISEKLDEATDIATFSDGSVVVVDYGNKKIKKWNNQGVFMGNWVMPSAIITEPYLINIDPYDNAYIYDKTQKGVFQFNIEGSPKNYFKINPRTSRPGEIGNYQDFFVDIVGQIHLLNDKTNQYEIWTWPENESPKMIFSMGSTGNGATQFDRLSQISFDPSTSIAYVHEDGNKRVKAFQIALRPPSITENVQALLTDTNFDLHTEPIQSLLVKGYRLKIDVDGKDSVIAESKTFPIAVPSFYGDNIKQMKKLNVFAFGTTSESKEPYIITDYFGYANYLFNSDQKVDAFDYYKNGLKTLTDSESNRTLIAIRYADAGVKLADKYELSTALALLENAYELSPGNSEVVKSLGHGFGKLFEMLVAENKYNEMLDRATQALAVNDATLKTLVVEKLIGISSELKKAETVEQLQYGAKMYAKLQEFEPNKTSLKVGAAEVNYALYKAKMRSGAPSFELAVQLAETEKAARGAKDAQEKGTASYHDATVLLLNVFATANKYDEVITIANEELQQAGIGLSEELEITYRLLLSDAYLHQAQADLAVLELQRVLTKQPTNETYLRLYAHAQVQNKQYDEAISIFRTLLMNNRDDARLIGEIGKVELLKGNFNEASFQIEKAIKLNPNLLNLYGPLAESFDGASQYQKAVENYKIAIRNKREEYVQARNQMLSSQITNEIQKNLISYENSLARIYLQLGNYESAIESYNNILSFNQANSEAWKGLGEALVSAGQVYEAINAFNTALKLNPTSEAISTALSNARNLRDEMAKNRPPVEVIKADVKEIFPSLYKNYADATVLSAGNIILANNTRLPYNNVELSFFVKELMDAPTPQQVKNLVGYSNTTIPMSAVFNDKILQNTESKTYSGVISLKYTFEGAEKVVEKPITFTIQSRNAIQWSDKRRLASFIEPSSGPLVDFIKKLDVLYSMAPTYGLNKHLLKAAAIYNTFTKNSFVYSPDPESGYQAASTQTEILDFMQYPAETILRRSGDCDDFVALMCGTLESSGISTAYIDVPGHVFMAFDSGLEPSEIQDAGLDPSQVIVMYNKVWIPIETTLLGTQDFKTSWKEAARRYYQEQNDGNFPELVPLADARSVYKPVSFVPADFNPELPSNEVLIQAQTDFANYLNGLTNARQISALEQRMQTEPRNIYVRNKLGILYAQTGDLDKASLLLKEAIELAPENALLYNNLGNIYLLQHQNKEAFDAYVKALELDNTDAEVYINLTKAQIALGDAANAKKSFDKATQMNADLKDLYDYLQLEF